MRLSRFPRRALLLGIVGVLGCDIAKVALDPTVPGIVQTWNFPASDMEVGVAELLPTGVDTNATKTAFIVSVAGIATNRRVGNYCALCQSLNGTTAPKPAFIISPDTGSTTSLPANVVSATVLGASLSYTIDNNLSFDPLRVNPSNLSNPQGYMVIVIRSGSLVLGRDSLHGSTTQLQPNTSITRTMPPCSTVPAGTPCFSTGIVTGSITVDLYVNSPVGEPVFINANGLLVANASVSNLEVASAEINIPSSSMDSGSPTELPSDLPEDLTENILGGRLEMMVTNPFGVTGTVNVQFAVRPGLTYTKQIAMPTTTTPTLRVISFTQQELTEILKGNGDSPTTFAMSGSVSSGSAVTVTPQQVVSISNRLVFSVRVGGE